MNYLNSLEVLIGAHISLVDIHLFKWLSGNLPSNVEDLPDAGDTLIEHWECFLKYLQRYKRIIRFESQINNHMTTHAYYVWYHEWFIAWIDIKSKSMEIRH